MIEVIDRRPAIRIDEPPEAPPTILYGWFMMPYRNRIAAARFENHPRMGSGKNIITSEIEYIDEVMGIAKSRNTTYILRDPA